MRNELECIHCETFKELIFSDININSLGEVILVKNIPILNCKSCKRKSVPEMALKFLCWGLDDDNIEILSSEKEWKAKVIMDYNKIIDGLEKKQIFTSTSVDFVYDKKDYFFIPGLQRTGEAYLVPVYFNIEVLLKYMYHPDYGMDIGSDTYGVIYKKNEFVIPFGINDNNRVIIWLGDIASLKEKEQYYLVSENIDSDHSIGSEFYKSQIDAQWSKPSKENDLLKMRLDFFEHIRKKYNVSMTHLELESIAMVKKIRKMIIDTEDAFRDFILPMNAILIESINVNSIKKYLIEKYPEEKKRIKEYRGIKALQFWLEKNTNSIDVSLIISPLYVLYDFRIMMAHLESNEHKKELWDKCCERLNLESDSTYTIIAECLVDKLREMYTTFYNYLK